MPLDSPIAYYRLNGLNDTGPNGFHVSNVNGVTFADDGVLGKAARFVAASSQRLERANEDALRNIVTGDFSLCVWAKWSSFTAWGGLFGKSSTAGWGLWMHGNDTNKIYPPVGGGFPTITLSSSFSTDTWYHLILSRIGSTVRFYRNNVEIGSASGQGGTTTDTAAMRIGWVNGNGGYFHGWLQHFGVYGYGFSAQDRADLYAGGAGYDPTAGAGAKVYVPAFCRGGNG